MTALRGLAIWGAGLLLAAAAHAGLAVALSQRAVPAAVAPHEGGFVVELAEVETSRGTDREDLALGAEARSQQEIAPSAMEMPPPDQPAPPPDTSDAALPQDTPPPVVQPSPPPPAPPQQAIQHDSTTHMQAALRDDADRARVQSAARPAADPQAVAEWMRALQIALETRKTYPEDARRAKAQGTVQARLTLSANGDFIDAAIVKSSGVPSLDRAAVDLLRDAGPYPQPPLSGANGQVRMMVPISYSLK